MISHMLDIGSEIRNNTFSMFNYLSSMTQLTPLLFASAATAPPGELDTTLILTLTCNQVSWSVNFLVIIIQLLYETEMAPGPYKFWSRIQMAISICTLNKMYIALFLGTCMEHLSFIFSFYFLTFFFCLIPIMTFLLYLLNILVPPKYTLM